jgi:hypothetical protein
MSFLMIENPGVAPAEAFTLLGASTSRYSKNANVIGQFGSGAKHAISLLMRLGYNPQVFCGKWKLKFFTEDRPVDDGIDRRTFRQVCVEFSGVDPETNRPTKRTENLGWVLEYGESDWTDINMALREFVANAFDRCEKEFNNHKGVNICFVDDNQVRAKDGTTRVFVEKTGPVERFVETLHKRFLQKGNPSEVAARYSTQGKS